MIIQTSSSKRDRFMRCFKDVFLRNKNIGIFYFCLSFIFLPLQFIMTISRFPSRGIDFLYNEFLGNSLAYTPLSVFVFYFLTITMAFAIPIIMLSFMQNKRACDVYHSLPYTRNELLGANVLSGILYIMVPLAIDFIVIAVASLGYPDARPSLVLAEIFYWSAPVLGVFAITTLVCVLVGTVFDSFLFSIGLHITPAVIWGLLFYLATNFLLGFDSDMMFLENISRLSPALIRLPFISYSRHEMMPPEMVKEEIITTVIWLFIAIAIFILAFFCYNRRKSEQAETQTEKGALSMLLRGVGTAAGGVLLASLFSATMLPFRANNKWFLLMVFLGSMIVYLVGDVIISKRFRRVKNAVIPGAIFSLAVFAVTSFYFFDIGGYAQKMPALEDIESVQVGHYNHNYSGRFDNQPDYRRSLTEYESKEVIEAVYDFHKAQAEYIKEHKSANVRIERNMGRYFPSSFTTITYKLKNGDTFTRNYSIPYEDSTESRLKLETANEFIEKNHPVFMLDETMVKSAESINLFGSKVESLNLSTRETASLLLALREDMLSDSGKDILNNQILGKISFLVRDEDMIKKCASFPEEELSYRDLDSLVQITVTINDGFKSTIGYLKTLGKLPNFDNDLSQLKGAVITYPWGNGNYAVSSISYNNAQNTGYKDDHEMNLPLDDLEKLMPDLRGYALYNVPHAKVVFISDPAGLKKLEIAQQEHIYAENTYSDNEVTVESAESIYTEYENASMSTGEAFIPYEKLPDKLKVEFLKTFVRLDDYPTDIWQVNHCGMTKEFFEAEIEKFKELL